MRAPWLVAMAIAVTPLQVMAGPRAPSALPGWPLYERLCQPCHGARGDGRGPIAWLSSDPPRDFTRGAYEWRTTPFGAPPADDDLRHAVRFGPRGTSMPAFDGLGDGDLDALIAVVKAFDAPAFATSPAPIALGAPPAENPARGAALWTQLGCDRCHGADGHGDGPAAAALAEPPYDLAARELRRPRERDGADDRRRAAAWSIATGITGSAMPGYAGQIASGDLWALADRVVAINRAAVPRADRSALDADAIAADRTPVATWPGSDADDASLFGAAIPPQGPPPASLAPVEASLSSAQCGRCHAKQVREWGSSIHAQAVSPGLAARIADGVDAASCRRCHAPLAEQAPDRDAQLYAEGVTCAGCHVRSWTRRGPPSVAPSLLALPGYPFAPSALYERADFCMPCHQLPPRTAVAGKPLLNTVKEWLEGPYLARGIPCQSCHMPNREHQWLGVHDAATFRQGIRLTASAHRDGSGAIRVDAELANVGAGHDLPTTPTPAVWLRVELVAGDASAHVVATAEQRIGRDVYWDGAWHERADTRIPPGASAKLSHTWPSAAGAASARVTVEVHPDDYYERFYAGRLAAVTSPPLRALYEAALRRARGSHYIAETRAIALP